MTAGTIMGSSFVLGSVQLLPYLFGLPALLSMIYFFILPIIPESPCWILMNKEDYKNHLDEVTQEVRLADLEKVDTTI